MGYLRSKVAITRRTLRDYGADGAPIFFLRNNGNFHKPPLPGSCMPAHNVFGCPHRKPNRRRVANVEKAKSLNLSLGLLRARFAKFVSARKNDVLVPDLDYQGILPAGRPRYPIMHDNSKTQAPSMPLVPIDTIFLTTRRKCSCVWCYYV